MELGACKGYHCDRAEWQVLRRTMSPCPSMRHSISIKREISVVNKYEYMRHIPECDGEGGICVRQVHNPDTKSSARNNLRT